MQKVLARRFSMMHLIFFFFPLRRTFIERTIKILLCEEDSSRVEKQHKSV